MRKLLDQVRRRRLFGTLTLFFIGAWAVLQVADLLFPGWHIPESSIRYVWIGAALLLPIAIVFSWRYDVSASGLLRTAARAGEDRPPLGRFDAGLLGVMAVLTVAIVGAVTLQVLETRDQDVTLVADREIPQNSIAVLPFANMGGEENEYFSDGITEQLLNELARMPELHVAARTSSFYFKGRDEDMRSIGQQLGVRTLLEGSVRRSGDSVRITAQLIDAESGYHLWSHTYDRELRDIFTVQDEIATAIVDTLRIRLAARDEARLYAPVTTDADAFDLYLQAMDVRRRYEAGAVQRSNEILREAIEQAPDFSLAIARLAYGVVLEAWYRTVSLDEASAEVVQLLDRALEIDPELEEAYETFGLLFTLQRDYPAANEAFERALEINPSHFGSLLNHGFSLVRQGRLKQASASYLQAQTMDPMNSGLNFNLGAVMMLMGEFNSGTMLMRRAQTLDPSRTDIDSTLAHWHRAYGRLAEALELALRVYEDQPENLYNAMVLAELYIDGGRLDDARRVLEAAQEVDRQHSRVRDVETSLALIDDDFEAVAKRDAEDYELIDALPGEPVSFADSYRIYRYAWSALLQGENEVAAENLLWAAGGEEGLAAITYDDMSTAKLLALAYRRLGRLEESAAIASQCLALADDANERGWATPQFFYRVAEIHAMQNDSQQAIENLTRAYEQGWRAILALEHSVFWHDLREDPELEQIKRMIYEDIERQLPLEAARSSGQQPAVAVAVTDRAWQ